MAYTQEEIGETSMDIDAGTAALLSGKGSDGYGIGGGLIGGLILGTLLNGRGNGLWGNGWGGAGVGTPAASAVATDVVLSPALQSIQSQLNTVQLGQQFGAVNCELEGIESDLSSQLRSDTISVNQSIAGIANQIANLSTAQAAGNFTTLQSINGLGSTITAQNNQNALQQLNSFNQLNTSMLESFNENSRDNANSFNQIIAGQNAQNATMAQCCCDIKSAIHSDGEETRALINALNVQNLQAQLSDAKTQNSNLQQSINLNNQLAAQTTTILHHLIPTATSTIV